VAAQEAGQRGIAGALLVDEHAAGAAVVEGQAETIDMVARHAATRGQPGEGESRRAGRVAVQGEDLAHGRAEEAGFSAAGRRRASLPLKRVQAPAANAQCEQRHAQAEVHGTRPIGSAAACPAWP